MTLKYGLIWRYAKFLDMLCRVQLLLKNYFMLLSQLLSFFTINTLNK